MCLWFREIQREYIPLCVGCADDIQNKCEQFSDGLELFIPIPFSIYYVHFRLGANTSVVRVLCLCT